MLEHIEHMQNATVQLVCEVDESSPDGVGVLYQPNGDMLLNGFSL